MILVPCGLILKQPDLGTALILGLVGFSVILFTKMKLSSFLATTVGGLAATLIAWQFIFQAYQKRRILSFLNPEADLLGSGYHANQSLIAVGSGKGLGKGFMASTQSQFSFLPEQHTDFIFSVFAEEWGFVGVLVVLFLFFALLFLILECARSSKDKFGVLASVGVFFLIFHQVLINVGMVSGMLPVVGVTLPFLSSGGSSLITIMLGLGFVLNINIRRYTF
jgi:rod shape determining protein RodA